MGWVVPRGNAQPPFFVFSHQCILNKERFWHGKEEGKTTPGKKKSQKLYVVPTIMSQLLCIFRDQPIAANTCTYPPRKTKKIHRRNLVSSGTEAGTGKQLTSNPLHTPTTHRPVPPTHTRPPLPNKCPRNPETPARHQRRPRVPRTNRHTTPFSRVDWRGLASEVGSGVGGVMSWSDGRVLVSAST